MGHSETLQNVSSCFQRLHCDEAFFYKLRPQSTDEPAGENTMPTAKAIKKTKPFAASTVLPRPVKPWENGKKVNIQKTYLDAETAFRHEDFAKAEELFEIILAESPEHLKALVGTGLLHTNQGHYAEARNYCARARSVDDLFADAYFLKGLILDMEGQTERAVVEYQKVLWLEPCFVAAHYALARISLRQRQIRDCRRQLLNTVKCLEKERPAAIVAYSGGMTREVFLELCRHDLDSLPKEMP